MDIIPLLLIIWEIGENNMVSLLFTFYFIFLGLLALGYEKYGSRELLESNPIIHLFDVYVKINVKLKLIFRKIQRRMILLIKKQEITLKKWKMV